DDGDPDSVMASLTASAPLHLGNATVDEADDTPDTPSSLLGGMGSLNLSNQTVDDGDEGTQDAGREVLNFTSATIDEGGETADAMPGIPAGFNLNATVDEGDTDTKVRGKTNLQDKTRTANGWSTGSGSGSRSGLMSSDITSISGRLGDAGTSFAGYTLLERIAEGGMGVVFKARQDALNRIVAVKIMKGGALASEYRRKRFVQEAEAAAALKHSHIVPIHEIAEAAGHPYYVMDYIQGTPIHDTCQKADLQFDDIASIMGQIADAVHHFHTRGIIHRDLKPDNILVEAETMEPKIIDFGIAKNLLQSEDKNMTREGAVLGTPHYMSPEQASGSHNEVDTRSDVYALGAIFYELLTGRLPFAEVDPKVLLFTILDKDPPTPTDIQSELPWELSAITMKAMEKDRERRYQTALELKDDIARYLKSEPIEAKSAGFLYKAGKFVKRRKGLVASCIGVFIVVVGLVGFIIQQQLSSYENDRIAQLKILKGQENTIAEAKRATKAAEAAKKSAEKAKEAQAGLLVEAEKAKKALEKAKEAQAAQLVEAKNAKASAELATLNAQKAEKKAKEAASAQAEAVKAQEAQVIAAKEAKKQAELAKKQAELAKKNAKLAEEAVRKARDAEKIAAENALKARLASARGFYKMERSNPLDAADNLRDAINLVRNDDEQLRLDCEKAFVDQVVLLANSNVNDRNTGLAEYWLRQAKKMKKAEAAGHKQDEIEFIERTIDELRGGLDNIKNARVALEGGKLAQARGELNVAIKKGAKAKDYGSLNEEIDKACLIVGERLVREGRDLLKEGKGGPAFAKAEEAEQLLPDYESAKILHQNAATRLALEARIQANDYGQQLTRQDQAVKELSEAAKQLEKFPETQKLLLIEKEHRRLLITDSTLTKFAYIPAVKFTDTKAFYMSRFEVTNLDYLQFVGDGAYDENQFWDAEFKEDDRKAAAAFWTKRAGNQQIARQPATHLSWYEARAYARWKTAKAKENGQKSVYRLPTIKEWEAAAGWDLKSQKPRAYPWGDEFQSDAMLLDAKSPADVGKARVDVSPFGVYDLGGSVSEWVVRLSKGKETQGIKGADYSASEAHAREFGRVANLAAPNPNPPKIVSMRFGFRLLREISSEDQ
ncbi:MAG: protein kinase, partial [Planctomycetota bacterium]|nr:protein kinase [Planctomycetota bacterium]